MKILVVSDTHGWDIGLNAAIKKETPFDMLIHLGDLEGSELKLQYTVSCPLVMVCGNNDFNTALSMTTTVRVPGHKIFVTHGHKYHVKMGRGPMCADAARDECDIVLYGHTHRELIEWEGNILVINPGSLTYPRNENHTPSYAVLTIDKDLQVDVELRYLSDEELG